STFKAVLEADADNMEARRGLLQVELASGQTERAREEIEALLSAGEPDAELLLIKGELDLQDGKLDAAIESLEAALALAPDNPLINMAMARALLNADKPGEASAQLDRLGPAAAEDPRVSFIRARIAEARGDSN